MRNEDGPLVLLSLLDDGDRTLVQCPLRRTRLVGAWLQTVVRTISQQTARLHVVGKADVENLYQAAPALGLIDGHQ